MPSHQLGEAPDEALEEAARLAREQAPSLCSGCDWNHGLWPTLRLLGLVTEPALHGAFLRPALAAVPGEGPRVLLSGAADHALLAQVLAAYAGRSPRITVLDICETPLMLNRWYAGRRGVAIETQRSDILDYEAAGAFDVVCTHAFLGHFDPPKRAALMRKWHSLLQPGGKVITVNRLRPGREPQWVAFSVDQVWAYRARVEEAARARGLQVPGLGRAAEAYAGRQAMFPLGSAMELGALLREAAFEVERMAVAPLASAKRQQVSLPTVPGSDDYVLLIAVRC
jgi:SAM-dependent methyltransferase